jgi:hypothetical protein
MANIDFSYRQLVVLFKRAALIAAPLASIGLAGCGPCGGDVDEIFLIRDPDAATQALIDACRAPVEPNCSQLCQAVSGHGYFEHCELHEDRAGYVQVHVGFRRGCPGGRRPQGLVLTASPDSAAASRSDRRQIGEFFARQFQLEAASVPAFTTLRRELVSFAAPPALARAARAAERDEVIHAQLTAALARRHGVDVALPAVAPTPVRSLAEMTDENVVEGCVREAYGALVATVQARDARDASVRAAMARIAGDETRHAALAFAVHSWAVTQLGPLAASRMAERRRLAVAELEIDTGHGWTPAIGAATGLPAPGAARALLGELQRKLWT